MFTKRSCFILLPLICTLTGCVVGPKYQPPVTQAPPAYKESPSQFKESGPWTVAQPQDAALRGDWWEIFNDQELSDLEKQLNINNQSIKEYFQQFMEARTLIGQARAQYFPTVTTSPGGTRSAAGSVQSGVYTLPMDVSWAPDVWGKVRNAVRESQYSAQVSAADLQNERLTEQASLAEYFFELRGQDALIQLYASTIKADQQTLNLTQGLYDTGMDDQISVVQAQNTLQAVEAAATNLGILRAQYEHAIAVLVGKAASDFSIPVKAMTTTAPPIPIGLPSQLLQRRPDIAAAERTMAAANAEIGVATAAYYPTLTLSASAGTETSMLKQLLSWPSRFWSIGPSLSETIYDGGLRRATVNEYIATYNADLASYRQTVLTGFQQVEDDLAAVRILSKEIQQQTGVVASDQKALDLELGRYETGVDPYLNVLTLQTTLLTDQQTLASLKVEQMTGAVELIEALGGGWDNSQLPTPARVTQKATREETIIQH